MRISTIIISLSSVTVLSAHKDNTPSSFFILLYPVKKRLLRISTMIFILQITYLVYY
jgi:hypothetical protein